MLNKQLSIDAPPIKAFSLDCFYSLTLGRSKGGKRFVVESADIDGKLYVMLHFIGFVFDL